jgi:hypothetical protein
MQQARSGGYLMRHAAEHRIDLTADPWSNIPVIESANAFSIVSVVAVGLAVIGISIAWLPGFRYGGLATLLARLVIGAGIVAMLVDSRGLGLILGIGLAALGAVAAWEARPAPEVPRPRRKGVVLASIATGVVLLAAIRGWGRLSEVPETAVPIVALGLGAVATLGTLAIADRSRIRMRDAVRERFQY